MPAPSIHAPLLATLVAAEEPGAEKQVTDWVAANHPPRDDQGKQTYEPEYDSHRHHAEGQLDHSGSEPWDGDDEHGGGDEHDEASLHPSA